MPRTLFIALLALLALSLAAACGPTADEGPDIEGGGDAICGDGVVDSGEQCDDGNTDPGDGCTAACQSETGATAECGNGVIESGEECDDANDEAGDGCDACVMEDNVCGDSMIGAGEECDDGNTEPGDGCDADCATEATCGDSMIGAGEECDDGNTDDGDGCSATCEQEAPVCAPAFDLSCGSTDSWSTEALGSTDVLDSYSCSTWNESGREYAYRFVADVTGDVTVSLSDLDVDLDLFVVSESGAGCDAAGCVSHGDSTLTFAATAGETYYVIVDGFNGASGSYTVDVACDAALECTPDIAAGCNTFDEWATTAKGSTDIIDSYSCSIFDESGREYAYQFSSPVDTTVTVNLAPESGQDLDLFLIGGACDPETCDQYGDSTLTFAAAAGQVYNVVVDGYAGAEGSYRVDFLCP
jgi:cysteine-rich repeat protein